MPVALEPNEKRLFWLKSDADKPLNIRPCFECSAFSKRTRIAYERIRNQIRELTDESDPKGETFDRLIGEGLKLGITGWRNFGKDYSFEALEETLIDAELVELFRGWPDAFSMTDEDRKNSQSPLQSDAESSAKDAPAGSVMTSQV